MKRFLDVLGCLAAGASLTCRHVLLDALLAPERITQILANSAAYDFKVHEDGFDLIFIDASHSYEYVKNNSESALSILAPGDLVFWHDYVSPIELTDVFRYLNELGRTFPLQHIRGTQLVYYRDPRLPRTEHGTTNGIEQLNRLEIGLRG
jgi:predicted O-methyltransferase YrrM